MIRLFAAVAVPDHIAEGLKRRQQGLPRAKWRPAEALHVTLRFFGKVAEPVAADLEDLLTAVRQAPFEIALQGAGAFGEAAHMRAVWAGVAPSEPLARLAAKGETVARKAGLKPEHRVFKPHVTLAYLRHSPDDRVAAWIAGHNLLHSPPFRVDRFGLYSSWLGSDGSRYDLEREYLLT